MLKMWNEQDLNLSVLQVDSLAMQFLPCNWVDSTEILDYSSQAAITGQFSILLRQNWKLFLLFKISHYNRCKLAS